MLGYRTSLRDLLCGFFYKSYIPKNIQLPITLPAKVKFLSSTISNISLTACFNHHKSSDFSHKTKYRSAL